MTRTALVTGSTRGIGAAIAVRLAADGMDVVVHSRSRDDAERQAQLVGGRAVAFDVADVEAVAAAVGELGTLDVLVNNAGADDFGFFTDLTPERWRRVLAVNLDGVLACTHAALPAMQAAGYGRIVNVASEAGRIGSKGNAPYAAAKGGVIAFSKSIARENARYGITSNTLTPGPIDTPLLHEMDERAVGIITGLTQLRRLGTPEEVAAAAAFLASEESSYVTGETLGVSGGMGLGG
jgi:2-hydroxycyclohexanecarboxyl-CoA dehydrogenase